MKITDLQPRLVWECFDEITKIPRPTHHLEKMKAFLVDWAERHNIPVRTDEVGNVAMTKPATPGHENAPRIILQGHQDMVAEKRGDKNHNFLTDPITTIVEGDWVRADGTTLGADNGLGCATGMAVLLDDSLVHGPLTVLLTVDEEQGLIGANGIAPDFVEGDILLNLDSEEHGQLVIGCAGSQATLCHYPVEHIEAPAELKYFRIHIDHLTGGHSGMEIHLGRANANQQAARFLWEAMSRFPITLSDFTGGGLPNAIPREASVIFGINPENEDELRSYAREFNDMIHAEYLLSEGRDFTFELTEEDRPADVLAPGYSIPLVSAIFATPNGVQGMSLAVPGLVETSSNLASVKRIGDDEILITTHQRSSVDSRRFEIADRVKALYEMIGCRVQCDDPSVGWAPNPDSKVLKVAEQCFEELFGYQPRVEALHAGLECGIFLEKMPGLDMVSFGPTLKDIHSPGEKANIPSVADFWKLLTAILAKLA